MQELYLHPLHFLRSSLPEGLRRRLDVTDFGTPVQIVTTSQQGERVRMVIEPGMTVATSLGAYPTFNFHVAGFGGEIIRVPYKADYEDPEALIAAAWAHRPKLVYLSNPDNPMGSHHPAPVIEAAPTQASEPETDNQPPEDLTPQ